MGASGSWGERGWRIVRDGAGECERGTHSASCGTSATVPYVEGAFSGRAWYQATYTNERAFTSNAATFGGGVQHFVNRRIALDASPDQVAS